MEFTQVKRKEVQGRTAESEEFDMDMRTGTIGTGAQNAFWGAQPAAGSGKTASGFAAQLAEQADAMPLCDPAGDPAPGTVGPGQGLHMEVTEGPAALGAGAPPRFIEGPGHCFANPAFDAWLEEMAPVFEAREAERLASLPSTHIRLEDTAVRELAREYGGGQMSQSRYDAFLEELADRGVLTRDEIKYMGYQGLIYFKPHDGVICYQSDKYGSPLEDINGSSLDWARKLMEYLSPDLTRAGLLLYAEERGIRPAFKAMLDVLERMNASC